MTHQFPTYKNANKISAVMTPEMCKAIRRQETNAGIDYWKHAINSERIQPTFRRMTHVNLDFPGIFLPNVHPTQSVRSKRKPPKPASLVLSRSKTSVMPEIKSSRVPDTKNDNSDNSKSSTMTDITCLQLADTLLSYNKSPFSGLFNTTIKPSRFEDYIADENNNDTNADERSSSVMSNGADDRETLSVAKSQQVQADDRILSPNTPQDLTTSSGRTSRNELDDDKGKPQTRPQKSILKNGNPNTTIIIRPSSGTSETYNSPNKPSVFSYQLPNSKPVRRSTFETTRAPSANMYPKIQNDLPVGHRHFRSVPIRNDYSGTVRNIPIRIERQSTIHGTVHDITSRKRSVRFNAAHQVHEYTPCEPVRYC